MSRTFQGRPHPVAPAVATHRRADLPGALVPLLLALGTLVGLMALFYPPGVTLIDESEFLSIGYTLREDLLRADIDTLIHRQYKYPLLWPLILSGFLGSGGWSSVFVANLLCHLLGSLFFWLILRQLALSPWLVLLYAFFPTLVYYDRTLMSDVSASVLVLGAFLFFLRGSHWSNLSLTGLLLGLSFLIRNVHALLFVPFFLEEVFQTWRTREVKKGATGLAGLTLSFCVPLAFQCLLNALARGNPLATGYTSLQGNLSEVVGPQFLVENLPLYLASVCLIYPLMAVSLPWYRHPRGRFALVGVCLIIVGFYSCYYFIQKGRNWLETLLVCGRFLLPAISLMLVSYAQFLEGGLKRLPVFGRRLAVGTTCLALVGVALALNKTHQDFLVRYAEFRDHLLQDTPPNAVLLTGGRVQALLNPAWGNRRTYAFHYFDRALPVDAAFAQKDAPVYLVTFVRPNRYENIARIDALAGSLKKRWPPRESKEYRSACCTLHIDRLR